MSCQQVFGATCLPISCLCVTSVAQGVAQGGRAGRAALHLPGAPRHRWVVLRSLCSPERKCTRHERQGDDWLKDRELGGQPDLHACTHNRTAAPASQQSVPASSPTISPAPCPHLPPPTSCPCPRLAHDGQLRRGGAALCFSRSASEHITLLLLPLPSRRAHEGQLCRRGAAGVQRLLWAAGLRRHAARQGRVRRRLGGSSIRMTGPECCLPRCSNRALRHAECGLWVPALRQL